MAGKEKLESYSPKMVHAGDFPVVTDSGTVASGETIHELMPITLGADGKIKAVTADTVADVYGLAAENAEEGEEVVYYLTGEFFGSAIEVPVGKTAADFKAPFRKIGKINTAVLNVRKGPGTNYPVTTQVKQGEVYTIVGEEKNGNTTWGKLKSGAGYISLGYTQRA